MSKKPNPLKQKKKLVVEESLDGSTYVKDWISQETESNIVQVLDSLPWADDLKRRTQQYGYTFTHLTQHIEVREKAPPLPDCVQALAQRLKDEGFFPEVPDQVIVNEYFPGQGINPHVDKTHCFEDHVASVSFLSTAVMDFRHRKTLTKKSMLLERRSMLLISGASRYDWTHGIENVEADEFEGTLYPRTKRISVTFRNVRKDYLAERRALKKIVE